MQRLFQKRVPEVHCVVRLISERVVEFVLPGNEKGSTLLQYALRATEINDGEYFSLQYVDRNKQLQWLRHQKPIYSQWKYSIPDRHSVTQKSMPAFQLRMAVKFYPNDPCQVSDITARYHLFCQVRSDIASKRLTMDEELFIEVAGMIMQSDCGDQPATNLLQIDDRLTMNLTPSQRQRIFEMHAVLRGRQPTNVEYMFLDKIKWLDGYGTIATEVWDENRNPSLFCLRPTSVYVERNGRKFSNTFWPKVVGFVLRKTALLMKVKEKKSMHCFYLPTKEDARNLWRLCEEHHAFFKKNFECRLMRSSSASVPGPRHVSKLTPNYDEETRLSMRGHKIHRTISEPNDNGSVVSASSINGMHSRNSSPAVRRPSVVSDRIVSMLPPDEEMIPPGVHSRSRAVHLSDVETDSYISRHTNRPYRTNSQQHQGHLINNGPHPADSVVTAGTYDPQSNGLHGSLHSLQSDPTGGPQGYRRARRRRSRPNSPPGKAGPPPELLDHIMFEPIEPPEDMTDAQRADIAYKVVETNAEPFRVRYSPRMKQRGRSWLKPAPPPTEILPHASGPVHDAQSDQASTLTGPTAGSSGNTPPIRPLPTRPNATSYPSRNVLSPVEAINRYASTLRAKQKDLMMRGGMYSPKSPSRHSHRGQHPSPPQPPPHHRTTQQHHHHHQQPQQYQQRSPPQYCFMATGHDLSLMTPPRPLHNASYSAAMQDRILQQSGGIINSTSPQRTAKERAEGNMHQRMTLL